MTTATIDAPIFYGKPLTFNPKSHRYTLDGQPIPSVTTILGRLNKPALIQWAANCAVDRIKAEAVTPYNDQMVRVVSDGVLEAARTAHATIRDAAGDVGTIVHAYAKLRMESAAATYATDLSEDETANRCCRALDAWAGEHDIRSVGVERKIVSQQYHYAGTCDFYGHIDGKLSVLDFKTGGERVYDEAWLQTSAYELALCEELGLDADSVWRWVVHINKKTGKVDAQKRLTSTAHTTAWIKLVEFDQQMRLWKKEAA